MNTFCSQCGHGKHGADHGLQARDCAEPGCGCGGRARETERLAHNETAAV